MKMRRYKALQSPFLYRKKIIYSHYYNNDKIIISNLSLSLLLIDGFTDDKFSMLTNQL